jgi:multiple sugar transport system permease protein
MADQGIPESLSQQETAETRIGGLGRLIRRRSMIAFLLCLPLILLIFGLVIYPALYAIYLSLLNKRMTQFV